MNINTPAAVALFKADTELLRASIHCHLLDDEARERIDAIRVSLRALMAERGINA